MLALVGLLAVICLASLGFFMVYKTRMVPRDIEMSALKEEKENKDETDRRKMIMTVTNFKQEAIYKEV